MVQTELEVPPGTKFINIYLVTEFPGSSNTQLASLRKTQRYRNVLDSVEQAQATKSDLHAHNSEQGGDSDTTTEPINMQAALEAPSSNAHNIGNPSGDISTTTVNPINNLDFTTALSNAINWSLLIEGALSSSSVEMLNEDLDTLIPSISRKGRVRQTNKKNCSLNFNPTNRLKRRMLYTKSPKLLSNNKTKSETVKSILNNTFGKDSKLPKLKSVEPFWKGLFDTLFFPDSRIGNCKDKLVHLLDLISIDKLEGAAKCTTVPLGLIEFLGKLLKRKVSN